MEEFLTNNASAVFAILGALVGAVITGLIDFRLKEKETRLRIAEKLLDKKLEAHENLIDVTNMIKTMVLLGGEDANGQLKRSPVILQSRENMDQFLVEFSTMQLKTDRWLSARIKREISLFLDYFVNLNERTRNASDVALQDIGVVIRNDFVTFAQRLENCAHAFVNEDLMKLNVQTDRGWHKFAKEQTLQELEKTDFWKNEEEIAGILDADT